MHCPAELITVLRATVADLAVRGEFNFSLMA